jgi:hypothetical protein
VLLRRLSRRSRLRGSEAVDEDVDEDDLFSLFSWLFWKKGRKGKDVEGF